ncbi:hypothetical protein DPMN_159089 [Dreissena polymorpha]|uniref:Uncharacterized protein n=1 Tax=Dreissena polymorpha TaxID=45954 RepID=A0A9D4IQE1_DREPO|nr:hypothetical protein DPMN_159089 [Dreissena polymorpha]
MSNELSKYAVVIDETVSCFAARCIQKKMSALDHLDEYLATYLLSIRKNDDDEYEPVTLRSSWEALTETSKNKVPILYLPEHWSRFFPHV